jgi:DNA-binding Lrp family transcriptional regulator
VERGKRNCGRISVFKGREARLNFAVFHILALKGPQTIYDIHKELKAQKGLRYIRYASVNKRVRLLKESGYINKIGVKKTKAGFQASVYELTARAYLAMLLNLINLDDLLMKVDEATASEILAAIMSSVH